MRYCITIGAVCGDSVQMIGFDNAGLVIVHSGESVQFCRISLKGSDSRVDNDDRLSSRQGGCCESGSSMLRRVTSPGQ